MRFTLRQLDVFLATARHGSLSRAADSLAMSQSAASSALRDLEDLYQVQLFDRVGKRLKINTLGLSIQVQAEALLEQAAALDSALSGDVGPGKLRVGATLTIGNYLAVELIAAFQQRFPGAAVALSVANTEAIVQQVLSYELDVGLIEGELFHPDLDIQPWRDDELVVFARPDHPLAGGESLDDDALAAATWVVREPGSGTRQTFDRAMAGLLPRLNMGLALEHTEAIKRAVAAGLGLGCLSRISLQDAFEQGSLAPLPAPHRDFSRRFSIVMHREKYRSQGLHAWLALCEEAQQMPLD
ncbi:MAG: LysR family transcriptional regulator [Pseudomonadota bacterium]